MSADTSLPPAANAQASGAVSATSTPACRSFAISALKCSGAQPVTRTSPPRDGAGDEEGAGLDAVGDDGVLGAVQPLDALDSNGGGPGAFDGRAHLVEQSRRGRLTSGSRAAFSSTVSPWASDRRHQQVFGAGDGDPVEVDRRAAQAVGSLGLDVAVLLADARAQLLQPRQVQVDRPRPDGAPARATRRARARSAPPTAPTPGLRRAWS